MLKDAPAQAVSQFGTDFEMIAALFPTRSRREVRNKFNKEDRLDPAYITSLIMKRKSIGASPVCLSPLPRCALVRSG